MPSLPDSRVTTIRTSTLLALVVASVTALSAASFAQVTTATSAPAIPATLPAATLSVPATTTAPAATAPSTQPFVGVVTADRVYVRPGPGTEYYQLVQLGKNDTVQVVGSRGTWYQILPPANVYCLIATSYVEPDADGKTGVVKGDYINVRAGSAVFPTRADAVLSVARRGAKLTILGTTDIAGTKYYKIAPLDRSHVFVASQFIRIAPGGTVPQISATTQRDTFVEVSPPPATAPALPPVETPRVVVVPPQPANTFAPGAYEKFAELNKKTVEELRKPVMDQDAGTMLENWKTFLRTENLPPSIKQASEARVSVAERVLEMQKIAKENRDDSAFTKERAALQEQAEAAFKAVEAVQNTAPYIAEGILRSSPIVTGRYALVNPITQRVVAYVDPSPEMDLSKLLDQYVGVRGTMTAAQEGEIKVIKVRNVTMLPAPKITTGLK